MKNTIILISAFFCTTRIVSQVVYHAPVRTASAGIPVRIEATMEPANDYLWAVLYVRKTIDANFLPIPMNGSGLRFSAEIPPDMVVIQGFYYYLEVTLQNRSKIIYPAGGPNLVEVTESSRQTGISFITPTPGQEFDPDKVKLSAVFRGFEFLTAGYRIYTKLDNQNVHHTFEAGFIEYNHRGNLPPGDHIFIIEITDHSGNTLVTNKVSFTVKPLLSPEEQAALLRDKDLIAEKKKNKSGRQKVRLILITTMPIPNPLRLLSSHILMVFIQ